jgi:hypothetical protein
MRAVQSVQTPSHQAGQGVQTLSQDLTIRDNRVSIREYCVWTPTPTNFIVFLHFGLDSAPQPMYICVARRLTLAR